MEKVIVYGGTGSLGRIIVRKLLEREEIRKVTVFSRDEAKHEVMERETEDSRLYFEIGDVREKSKVYGSMLRHDAVIYAAALKQVPRCEANPGEAIETNCRGARNVARAACELDEVTRVVGVSTDKACEPINAMGASKMLQEKIFIRANRRAPETTFSMVRLGNVVASTGSAIPKWIDQIKAGGPVTITDRRMRRFFMTRGDAADTVLWALERALRGEIIVKRTPSVLITDLVEQLMRRDHFVEAKITGIRPSEKLIETLVSEYEGEHSVNVWAYEYEGIITPLPYIAIQPDQLPHDWRQGKAIKRAYRSDEHTPIEDVMELVERGLQE